MFNREILMCRPDYFRIAYQLNPYMDPAVQPDRDKLGPEYEAIVAAHQSLGRTIHFLDPAPEWPDMTYTANTALVRGKTAVLANLPKERSGELTYASDWLSHHGYEVIPCPYLFSGQGDALPTGTGAVIKGRGWRSDPKSDDFVADALGYEVIPIQTTGPEWYDDDLTISVLRPGLLAVCFEALDEASGQRLRARSDLRLIPIDLDEAKRAAANLVSDGQTVIMPTNTPKLTARLEHEGLRVINCSIAQLWTGGGGIRCTSLTLDNK